MAWRMRLGRHGATVHFPPVKLKHTAHTFRSVHFALYHSGSRFSSASCVSREAIFFCLVLLRISHSFLFVLMWNKNVSRNMEFPHFYGTFLYVETPPPTHTHTSVHTMKLITLAIMSLALRKLGGFKTYTVSCLKYLYTLSLLSPSSD